MYSTLEKWDRVLYSGTVFHFGAWVFTPCMYRHRVISSPFPLCTQSFDWFALCGQPSGFLGASPCGIFCVPVLNKLRLLFGLPVLSRAGHFVRNCSSWIHSMCFHVCFRSRMVCLRESVHSLAVSQIVCFSKMQLIKLLQ